MRTVLLCCVAAVLLLTGPTGCGGTINDPSGEFYRQHPEYDPAYNTPKQFNPVDHDD